MSPFMQGLPPGLRLPLVATPEAPELFNWTTSDASGYQLCEQPLGTKQPKKILILGAGASGLDFLKRFTEDDMEGIELVCYEKNADVGGTWLENTYPGVACDIPSVSYQFTWEPHIWPQYYSTGHEIFKYLRGIAEKYDLLQYIHLGHRVTRAEWSDDTGQWQVSVVGPDGQTIEETCDMFVNSGGALNDFRYPDIEGLHSFKGALMHTANWDRSCDLTGKRVVVIGAGSSAAQVVPSIVGHVESLHVIVKSPTWITAGFAQKFAGPDGRNFSYSESQQRLLRDDPKTYLAYRKMVETEIGQRFRFLLSGSPEAKVAREYSEAEMRHKLKGRSDLIAAMVPTNFSIGCRRPTPGDGFLESLAHAKTTVHTRPIQRVTETGFVAHDGTVHDVDAIVCATGFNTSWVPRFPVVVNGTNLQDRWTQDQPLTYLGVAVPGVPNYFLTLGPYAPLAVGSLLPIIEHYVNYIRQAVVKMQREHIKSLTPKMGPVLAFKAHHDLFVQRTAWTGPCSSWFKQGDPNGSLTMYPGSRVHFFELLATPRYEDYDIEYASANQWHFLGNGFALREFDGRDTSFWMGLLDGEDREPVYDADIIKGGASGENGV